MDTLKNLLGKLPPWTFTIVVGVVILWLTLDPNPLPVDRLPLFEGADKVVHALMFGGLTGAAILDFWRRRNCPVPWLVALLAATCSSLAGVTVEFLQPLTDRGFEWADWLADATGSFLVALGWMVVQRMSTKKNWLSPMESQPQGPHNAPANTGSEPAQGKGKKPKKHLVRPRWLRISLKTLMWVMIVILLLPVLVYIPPVQTLLKDTACKIIRNSTGMDVKIERFRLKFPLDVSLQGVSMVEANGDTLVAAQEALADVKLLPLLKMDIRLNKLSLTEGYYRMVSPDSSMVMKIRAGYLQVDDKSSFNLKENRLVLNKASLDKADVSLFMDVWKQKRDTTSKSTPFFISIGELKATDLRFSMGMLPTIDTLVFNTSSLLLRDGKMDLASNSLKVGELAASGGYATYITPTPEYIASHPVPIDTLAIPSAPFTIEGRKVSLEGFAALYAVKGATPVAGFDASYIQATGIDITLENFYNQATTLRLPIAGMKARERCGLEVTAANGLFAMQDEVITLSGFNVTTPNSHLEADMSLPMAVMQLEPSIPFSLKAAGSLGIPDAVAFMPDLSQYTNHIPRGVPLDLDTDIDGTLADLTIRKLNLALPTVLDLQASGNIRNALEPEKLAGNIKLDAKLLNPRVADNLAGGTGLDLPTLTLHATAVAQGRSYSADINMHSSAGDLLATGKVNLNAESYHIVADVNNLDVARFAPDLGLGNLTCTIKAAGAGFNPTKPHARTDAAVNVVSAQYRGHEYRDIDLFASLADGAFGVNLSSPDPLLDLTLAASGNVAPDDYRFDIDGDIRYLDLGALGLMDSVCSGSGRFLLRGNAQPSQWLYDIDLDVPQVSFQLPGQDHFKLDEGLALTFRSSTDSVDALLESKGTEMKLKSSTGLKDFIDRILATTPDITRQINERYLDFDTLHHHLPPFCLTLDAAGSGLLRDFLSPLGYHVDTLYLDLDNTDKLEARAGIYNLTNPSLAVDTLWLTMNQRGGLMDYFLHMGNRPGTLDEFHKVDIRGYVGTNRLSMLLNQQNLQGETGYRLGLTGAFQDSTVTLHFTPLKSTIAYLPWTFNADNHIDLGPGRRIDANLLAQSSESKILLETVDRPDGNLGLHANLENIRIQDFLRMSMFAPQMTGSINSDINLELQGRNITGNGTLGVKDFTYESNNLGNFDMNFNAALDMEGDTKARATLLVNGQEAIQAFGIIRQQNDSVAPIDMGVRLQEFPLSLANAFLDRDMMRLSGNLNGNMRMKGTALNPRFNGALAFDSVAVFIPMMGSALRFGETPVKVDDNVVSFNDFSIWGQNANPLTVNGTVNARSLRSIMLDVALKASNFQLVGSKRGKSDIYGKAFVDIDASARGPLSRFDINGNVSLLSNTDVSYVIPSAASSLQQMTTSEGVVKFVQFSDTTQVEKTDTVSSSMAMRINAALTIANGAKVSVFLSGNGTDRVTLTPSGTLYYFQNFMGDMNLNGQLNLGTGYVQYNIPVLGRNVKFTFEPNSYVTWNGEIMNPSFSIQAIDAMKVNVAQRGGNSSLVNFDVGLSLTNNLASPKVLFDLSTKDDITIQNQLQGMTAEQRSNQAMNLLLYGQYLAQGYESTGFNSESMLYGFLTSQINSWAANHIRGVDLTFGVDQYQSGLTGNTQTTTSYSYQVSKSLFNNKFKIIVGGNYSTDASADENFSQNLINDIAFEYMLRQTNNMSLYFKLFRHTGFESILEGQITETGLGVVMRRRLSNFNQLFRFNNPKPAVSGHEK